MSPRPHRTDLGSRYVIIGGAGFIGSHFTDSLLADPTVTAVTLYDNFASGREWHYEHHASDDRLRVVRGDVSEIQSLGRYDGWS
jgi:UDP-glucose 4-epimerase